LIELELPENRTIASFNSFKINRTMVESLNVIGSGHFGEVHKGILKSSKSSFEIVAIKTIKVEDDYDMDIENALKERDKLEQNLVTEANIMANFNSNYVVRFKGMCLTFHPYLS
jgi:serine/threonine protein kinase